MEPVHEVVSEAAALQVTSLVSEPALTAAMPEPLQQPEFQAAPAPVAPVPSSVVPVAPVGPVVSATARPPAEGAAVPRRFALLEEMNQQVAARAPARQTRPLRDAAGVPKAPAAADLATINRAIRTGRVPVAQPVTAPEGPDVAAMAPALLAEVTATLLRRAAPGSAATAARRPRQNRTP
jgi:hypothetical protein